jgi:cell division septal protein FtsQ
MKEVMQDNRVREARIQREFPSLLRVLVIPHDPVLGLLNDRGMVQPIARDGTLLPALQLKNSPSFPILRGSQFAKDAAIRSKAIELIIALPETGMFVRKAVSEVAYHKSEGFRIFLADQFAEIKMGDGDFAVKAGRVERVLTYLHNRSIKGRVIDARFTKKVVVRVRNGS